MAGTFSQLYIQVVVAVKDRENLIDKLWKDDLHKYIAGIIKGKEQNENIQGKIHWHPEKNLKSKNEKYLFEWIEW